jgi:hypothetical protein
MEKMDDRALQSTSQRDDGDTTLCYCEVVADPAPSLGSKRIRFDKMEVTRRVRSCLEETLSSSCKHAPPSQPIRKASHENLMNLVIDEEIANDYDWTCNIETSDDNDYIMELCRRTSRQGASLRRFSFSQVLMTNGRLRCPSLLKSAAGAFMNRHGRQKSATTSRHRWASFPRGDDAEGVHSRWDTNAAPSSSRLGRASRG